jgi:hypothetical protein
MKQLGYTIALLATMAFIVLMAEDYCFLYFIGAVVGLLFTVKFAQ